jgi:hypothetical protein
LGQTSDSPTFITKPPLPARLVWSLAHQVAIDDFVKTKSLKEILVDHGPAPLLSANADG